MSEDYGGLLEGSGRYLSISILYQVGPISKEVCDVTLKLLKLAEKCWDPKSMKELGKQLPHASPMAGMLVGSGLHGRLYDLAKRTQAGGWLPADLKITRPVTRVADPRIAIPTLNRASGPDFVWRGMVQGSPVDVAWDLTTNNALARHYDRDVLGLRRDREQRPDLGIQQVEDTLQHWDAYIAICY